jgi:type I restriction enzyme S subunit
MPIEVPRGWRASQLGEIASVILSNVDKKSVTGQPSVKLCNYMDVYVNENITSRIDFMEATATPAQIERFGLQRGDVMITKDSEDPTDIAVPSVVVEDLAEPVLCGYHLALLRPKAVLGEYLAWALRSWPVNNQFVRRANGATRFGLTSGVIHDVEVPLPPLSEQKKIAAILSSVDDAIQATQAVIDQTRQVKEGLLQDLLTKGIGHTRFKQTEIGGIHGPIVHLVLLLTLAHDGMAALGGLHTQAGQHSRGPSRFLRLQPRALDGR